MTLVKTVLSVVLGVVFVLAGASKIARGREWPVQAAAMGTPKPVALAVPWWELLVGALLVTGLLSPWPSFAAALTLVAFTALLARRLSRGEHPPCACFGAWSTTPLGWHHVVRNLVLLAIAAALIVSG